MPVLFTTILLIFLDTFSFARADRGQHHIILKNDFNNDGTADRIVFASYGISGFYQATHANKKVDTFFIQQGNRSIFFLGAKDLGGPYLKLIENAGIFSTVSLLTYKDKKFHLVTTVVLPNKKFFSDESIPCPNDILGTQTKKNLTYAEAITKFSTEEIIKKAIAEDCKSTLGHEYQKFESQILSACGVSDGKPEKNDLITCLDKNENTRYIGGGYKAALAGSIFGDGFKISCSKSDKDIPLASLDSSSRHISFFETTPAKPNRSFKADFFHEMSHLGGVTSDKLSEDLVKNCLISTEKSGPTFRAPPQSEVEFKAEQERLKDGVKISLPTQYIESTSIGKAVTESSKMLDTSFSMDNSPQFESLSSISKAAFKSFEPMMNAAYSAAVPKVFATDALINDSGIKTGSSNAGTIGTAHVRNRIPGHNAKILPENAKSSNVTRGNSSASANTASIEPSPGSTDTGTDNSQAALNSRNIASLSETAGAATSSGSGTPSLQASVANENVPGPRLNFASATDPRSQALSKNVPRIAEEEDFIKTITTGKYEDVRKRLTDPKNIPIMVDKRIQYRYRRETIGSTDPMIILNDLGNGFSVRRVLND